MSLRKSLTTSSKVVSADKTEEIVPQSPTLKTPDSPAVKVKHREAKYNPDPMYYHPDFHPDIATTGLFKRKSKEIETELRNSGNSPTKSNDGFKVPLPKIK